MVATVTMTGRVGTNPQFARTTSDVPYARFRLAHTPRLRRGDEWVDGQTLWCTVRCYGNLAKGVQSLRSGDPAVVVGQWRHEEWTDENGVVRSTQVLLADSVGPDLRWCAAHLYSQERDERVPDRDSVADEDQVEEDEEGGVSPEDSVDSTEELIRS